MTPLHDAMWAKYDDEHAHKTVICSPRGIGKTTQALGKVCHDGVFRIRKFVYWVSQTLDLAEEWTENIKGEILHNPIIRDVFGKLKSKRFEDEEITQSKKAWYLTDPKTSEPFMVIIPRGSNQRVRGKNIRIEGKLVRPDLEVIDDPEHDEEIANEENRKAFAKWLHGSLLPCVDTKRLYAWQHPKWDHARQMARVYDKDFAMWRVLYMDTLKHEDAQIAHLLSDGQWSGLRQSFAEMYKRQDWEQSGKLLSWPREIQERATKFFGDHPSEETFYASNMPTLVSDIQVWHEIQSAKKRPNGLTTWFNEKMCLPMASDSAGFTRSLFQHYSDTASRLQTDGNVFRFVVFDPARSGDATADYSAILAVAIDTTINRIYMRRLFCERVPTLKSYDMCLAIAAQTNSRMIAVDDTGLKEHIRQPLIDRASMMNLGVKFTWLKNLSSKGAGDYGTGREAPKRARAGQIAPYYQSMTVWHDHSLKEGPLEQQMLSYPKPGKWDALDCAGYIPQIMSELGIHFTPVPLPKTGTSPFPAFTENADEQQQALDILQGRWRRI